MADTEYNNFLRVPRFYQLDIIVHVFSTMGADFELFACNKQAD